MGKAIQTAIVKVMGTLDPSVARSVAEANKKFSGIKAGVAVAGAAIAGATTAAVAFGKTSLDAAAKFETGMSNVATLLDGDTSTVNKRIAEMGDGIMDIAKKTGLATDDLSNGMYQIVSALGDSADATSQLEVAAKAAKAGGATTVDAINLLSAVTKGYGDTSGEAWSKASDLAFQTVKLGQTSFPELASSMGKVVPIASALNISQEELFGSFATLTGVTGSTAEVSTQLKSVFSGLMTPSTALSAKISELGFESANAMLDQLGLIGTLDKLSAACGDDKQAVAKLFSSVEAQTAVLALAGSQTENWVQKTEAMAGAADATSNAFDKSTDNLQGKLDKMKQVFETFKIRVGNILIPIVTNIVDKAIPKIEKAFDTLMPILTDIYKSAQPVIQAFANAIPGALDIAGKVLSGVFKILKSVIPIFSKVFDFAKKGINWIIDDSKILMPVLSGVLGGILAFKAVNTVVSTFNSVKKAITGVKTAMVAVKAFMAANPVGLIIAGVVAVSVAFVMLYKKCEPFRNFINKIGAEIKKVFQSVIDWFKRNVGTFKMIFDGIKKTVQIAFIGIKKIFSNIIGFVKNVFTGNWKGAWENVKNIFSNLADLLIHIAKTAVKTVVKIFKNLPSLIVKAIKGLEKIGNKIAPAVNKVLNKVKKTVYKAVAQIAQKFPALGKVLGGVVRVVETGFNLLKNVLKNVIGFVKNVFSGNWKGAWENVKNIVKGVFEAIPQIVSGICDSLGGIVDGVISTIIKVFEKLPETVSNVISKVGEYFPVLGDTLQTVWDICTPIIDGICEALNPIKDVFVNIIDFVKNVFTGQWSAAWENIKNIFKGVCDSFASIIQIPFNVVIGIFNSLPEKVSSVIASIGERFPILGSILQTVWDTVSPIIEGIKTAISSIKDVFVGIIDFIKNIFTGQWSAAWESVKNIFGSIWSGLVGLVKAPLNAVISLVNSAIGGLNRLHVSIPDWVPGVGGKEFGINIPKIPMLATGGIATQPSICGEGGYPEYVISTDPKYREQNQKTVLEAANAIGALETAQNEGSSVRSLFKKFNGKGNSSTVNNNNESTAYRIEFSPVINISGNTNNARSIADEVMRVFDDYQGELADKIKAVLATAREGSYGI